MRLPTTAYGQIPPTVDDRTQDGEGSELLMKIFSWVSCPRAHDEFSPRSDQQTP